MKLLTLVSRIVILELAFWLSFILTWSNSTPRKTDPSPAQLSTTLKERTPPKTPSVPQKQNVEPDETPTLAQSQPDTPIPNETEAPPSDRCIIIIDGARYDITQFRSIHSGGDIFACGTDMSTIFWGRHDQAHLEQMARYRI